MKRKPQSVKWKLFMYFGLFSCIMLVILWMFQTVFLDSFYQTIKKHAVHKCTQTIEKNIDYDHLENLLKNLSQGDEMSILILKTDGSTFYASDNRTGDFFNRTDASYLYEYYQKAEQNGGTYIKQFQNKKSELSQEDLLRMPNNGFRPAPRMTESILEVRLLQNADGENLILYVNAVISPVDATVSTLRVQLLWVTALMLILAFFLAWILARRISRPVEKMNNAAKTLASGNYDISFEGGSYREINELAQTLNYAAGELSRVEQLRRELMANISHDLRTPLTMITGYGEMMRDVPGENNTENINVIIGEAKRLTTLVNDVLDLTKLQSEQTLNLQVFDLTQELLELVNRYDKLAPDYHITFSPQSHALVKADKVHVLQAAYNLINNAITYTGSDRCVQVNQQIENGFVRVEIKDTGEGIAPEELSNIWQRYYRSSTHKRATVGTGLGLSIVRSVIDRHNELDPGSADCGVESKKGVGSCFWFALRLHKEI